MKDGEWIKGEHGTDLENSVFRKNQMTPNSNEWPYSKYNYSKTA